MTLDRSLIAEEGLGNSSSILERTFLKRFNQISFTSARASSPIATATTDLLSRNVSTGATQVWSIANSSPVVRRDLPTETDTNWQVAGIADFNRDGQQDLLWRNFRTGAHKLSRWILSMTSTGGLLDSLTLIMMARPIFFGTMLKAEKSTCGFSTTHPSPPKPRSYPQAQEDGESRELQI
jgi:hypothetical protein